MNFYVIALYLSACAYVTISHLISMEFMVYAIYPSPYFLLDLHTGVQLYNLCIPRKPCPRFFDITFDLKLKINYF